MIIELVNKMNNQKITQNLNKKLKNIYNEDLILLEPRLLSEFRTRPDVAIYQSGKKNLLMVIEIKNKISDYLPLGILQLKKQMQEYNVPYGALISEDSTLIFKITKINGKEYESTIANFPKSDGTYELNTRPFKSIDEFRFCISRIYDILREKGYEKEEIFKDIVQNLHRKLFAEQKKKSIFLSDAVTKELQDIDKIIKDKINMYEPDLAPPDSDRTKTIIGIFQAFNINETPSNIKKQIINDLIQYSDETKQFSTSSDVAEFLVKIANIKNEELVLEPGSGLGTISRKAKERGAEVYGIEINRTIANYQTFLNNLLGEKITLLNGDFLSLIFTEKLSFPDVNHIPNQFDHILMDPPIGTKISVSNTAVNNGLEHQNRFIEEMFLEKSLTLLKNNGKLTAVIPLGILSREGSSAQLRKFIRENYRISTIIEIESGLILPRSSIATAIIQISAQKPKSDYKVNVAIIRSKDNIESRFASILKSIENNTIERLSISDFDSALVPSKVLAKSSIEHKLKEKFSNVKKLGEISYAIDIGLNIKRDKLVKGLNIKREKSVKDEIRFIQISDITSKTRDELYVKNTDGIKPTLENDILVSVKGTIGVIDIPRETVVPSNSLAVVRFHSKEEAVVYAQFLESSLGQEQIKALVTGSIIPYLSIRDLREILVPFYSDDELKEKYQEVLAIIKKKQELAKQKEAMKKQLEDIF